MAKRTCSIDGCERLTQARGWCSKHYTRWYHTGNPLPKREQTFEQRFWKYVDRHGDDGCWLWTGAPTGRGYGQFQLEIGETPRRVAVAHKVSYELHVGPVPDGLELDHLCRNRLCVNPAHLEPVTHAENVRRGEAGKHHAIKTHCPQGHPYDAENTYWRPDRPNRRDCRACRAEANRRVQRRKQEVQP